MPKNLFCDNNPLGVKDKKKGGPSQPKFIYLKDVSTYGIIVEHFVKIQCGIRFLA